MKASKKSIHARLYNLTYDGKLPNNLCPYFWKLVWATIVFIPNIIIQLPTIVVDKITNEETENLYYKRVYGIIWWIVLSCLFYYISSQIHLFKAIFNFYSYDSRIASVGISIDICIAILLLIIFSVFLQEKFSLTSQNKEKKPSIISEYIKAKKNKYCPKIDWE